MLILGLADIVYLRNYSHYNKNSCPAYTDIFLLLHYTQQFFRLSSKSVSKVLPRNYSDLPIKHSKCNHHITWFQLFKSIKPSCFPHHYLC
jgi:hypothetical protein